jgi:hypothetical protein
MLKGKIHGPVPVRPPLRVIAESNVTDCTLTISLNKEQRYIFDFYISENNMQHPVRNRRTMISVCLVERTAMVPPDVTDPASILLDADATTRNRLRGLRAGAGRAADRSGRLAMQAAIDWLEGPAQAQRCLLEDRVLPALVEAMAGSDAVCLRDLAERLANERSQLDRCWRAKMRPQLATGASGAAELQAWISAFEGHLRRIDDELLPMIPRLLDDEALDALGRACRVSLCEVHPSAPTGADT